MESVQSHHYFYTRTRAADSRRARVLNGSDELLLGLSLAAPTQKEIVSFLRTLNLLLSQEKLAEINQALGSKLADSASLEILLALVRGTTFQRGRLANFLPRLKSLRSRLLKEGRNAERLLKGL